MTSAYPRANKPMPSAAVNKPAMRTPIANDGRAIATRPVPTSATRIADVPERNPIVNAIGQM